MYYIEDIKTSCLSIYLPVENIDLPVLDVHVVSQFRDLRGEPVTLLSGLKTVLGLLLDGLVLLLKTLSEFLNLQGRRVRGRTKVRTFYIYIILLYQ